MATVKHETGAGRRANSGNENARASNDSLARTRLNSEDRRSRRGASWGPSVHKGDAAACDLTLAGEMHRQHTSCHPHQSPAPALARRNFSDTRLKRRPRLRGPPNDRGLGPNAWEGVGSVL